MGAQLSCANNLSSRVGERLLHLGFAEPDRVRAVEQVGRRMTDRRGASFVSIDVGRHDGPVVVLGPVHNPVGGVEGVGRLEASGLNKIGNGLGLLLGFKG